MRKNADVFSVTASGTQSNHGALKGYTFIAILHHLPFFILVY
jgi:hypothetical protein